MDLGHLGAVGERLAVPGHAGLLGFDHRGIREDHGHHGSVLTDGDNLPGLVSPELGEREPTRHLQGVLILGGHGAAAQGTDERRYDSNRSEEHTSELQSQSNLVCRLLLEKKKRILSKNSSSTSRRQPERVRTGSITAASS